jgi:hypothetical protein
MSDLEDVTESSKQIEYELTDFLSREQLDYVRNWAFEYAYQESKIYKVPKSQFSNLCAVRRLYALRLAQREVLSFCKRNPQALAVEIELPEASDIRRLILEGYTLGRRRR